MSVPAKKVTKLRDPAQVELQPINQHPRMRELLDRQARLRTRTEQAENRQKTAVARIRGTAQTLRPPEMRAADLVAGGSVQIHPAEAELIAAQEELEILNAGRLKILEDIETVKGELSRETCRQFASVNAEGLRQALSAVEALHEALESLRVMRGKLMGAGFSINETELPINVFPHGAALGDPNRAGTPAYSFKVWLKQKKII